MIWKNNIGCYIIAEIGGNHEGNFNTAINLTHSACESGVDAVKYQIYLGDTLVNKSLDPERNLHFKKFELKKEEYLQLKKICESYNVSFTASVWDIESIDWIDDHLKFYKVGSGDLSNFQILKKLAQKSKPIILSTGLSDLETINDSVNFLISQNQIYKKAENLGILQCTSLYPNIENDCNLNVINQFKREFTATIGYSDHTTNSLAAEIAFTLGAEILELHFTDNKDNKAFRDHQVSFTKDEIINLINKIKEINVLKGTGNKHILNNEVKTDHVVSFKRAIYPKKVIQKGHKISEADLVCLRPMKGIEAKYLYNLIGKIAKTEIGAYQELNWDFFD